MVSMHSTATTIRLDLPSSTPHTSPTSLDTQPHYCKLPHSLCSPSSYSVLATMPDPSPAILAPDGMDITPPSSASNNTAPPLSDDVPHLTLTFPPGWTCTTVEEVASFLAGDRLPPNAEKPNILASTVAADLPIARYLDHDIRQDRLPTFVESKGAPAKSLHGRTGKNKNDKRNLLVLECVFGERLGIAHLLAIEGSSPAFRQYVSQLAGVVKLNRELYVQRAQRLKALKRELAEVEGMKAARGLAMSENAKLRRRRSPKAKSVQNIHLEFPVGDGLFLRREIANLRVWLERNNLDSDAPIKAQRKAEREQVKADKTLANKLKRSVQDLEYLERQLATTPDDDGMFLRREIGNLRAWVHRNSPQSSALMDVNGNLPMASSLKRTIEEAEPEAEDGQLCAAKRQCRERARMPVWNLPAFVSAVASRVGLGGETERRP